jgi:hypothetical protein
MTATPNHALQRLRPIAKVLVVAGAALVAVAIAVLCLVVWEFGTAHHLTTLKLGDHQVRLKINYHYDVAHDVVCELSGPKVQHPAQIMAYIGATESVPGFTVHQATNHQVFWVTADTLPKTILYALNAETGKRWPAPESGKDGQDLLDIANKTESGYRLYGYEWIGIKK